MAQELDTSSPAPGEPEPSRRSYRVKLEVFEGPLDLLLHLIRKNELDIINIPISLVTEQYLEYVDLMKELDLEVAGEFVVMAATLVHIKTRMLLPHSAEPSSEEVADDPRHELVTRLIEHQRYKAAATALLQRELLQDQIWWRPPIASTPITEDGEQLIEVGLFDLLATLKEIIERAKGRVVIEVEPERFSVNDKIQLIADRLQAEPSVTFESLFEDARGRREIIVTFLALLEMIRLRMIRVLQRAAFASIWVFRRGDEAPVPEEPVEAAPES